MATDRTTWEPFGIPDEAPETNGNGHGGVPWLATWRPVPPAPRRRRQIINVSLRRERRVKPPKDRAAYWLRNAMLALGALAVAAATVSYAAQYRMVLAYKGAKVIAGLEAAIPDVSALVFASLGIALALHGKRAIRARMLNVGAVVTSIGMNYLAAAPGWRGVAIWVMPPVAYALASDTAIGVVRAWTLARQRQLDEGLADDEVTPLGVLAGFLLWLLRLALAPASTLSGFRRWVVEECPVAPGRRVLPAVQNMAAPPAATGTPGGAAITRARQPLGRSGGPRRAGKTARFLARVREVHGPLSGIHPGAVSRICTELAPEVGLNTGSARSALLPLVRDARTESGS